MAVMTDNRRPLCTLLEDHGVDPKSVVADSVWISPDGAAHYGRFVGGLMVSRWTRLRREPLMWYLACTQAHDERKR